MNNSIEDLDFRDSIWERFVDEYRVKSCQAPGTSILSRLLFKAWSGYDVTRFGKTKLYRIDTLEHVLSAIDSSKLWLPHPTSWEDPWEDPVMRHVKKNAGKCALIEQELKYDCFR